MKTMLKERAGATTGCQSLTTKAVHTFLALTMLAILAVFSQPAGKHIGEEIPQVVYHPCPSCGEEIPQVAYAGNLKMAGGVAGGVVWRNRG